MSINKSSPLNNRKRGSALDSVIAQMIRDPGISLRDYFAGQALAGIIGEQWAGDIQETAEVAYDYADAMLKAREAKP